MDPKRKPERFHPETNPDGVRQPEILFVWQIAKAFNEVDEHTIIRQRDRYLTDLMRCEIVSTEIEAETYERIRKGTYRSPEDTRADKAAVKITHKGISNEALAELFDDDDDD